MSEDWRNAAAAEYRAKRAKLIDAREMHKKNAARAAARANATAEEIRRLDDGALAFGLPLAEGADAGDQGEDRPAPFQAAPLFKDVVLEILKEAYPRPMRATAIKAEAEKRLGREFHDKTTGMSLYRLSQKDAVQRIGWNWLYVPEEERKRRRAEITELAGKLDLEDLMQKTK